MGNDIDSMIIEIQNQIVIKVESSKSDIDDKRLIIWTRGVSLNVTIDDKIQNLNECQNAMRNLEKKIFLNLKRNLNW